MQKEQEIVSFPAEHKNSPNTNDNSVGRIRRNMKTIALSTAARPFQIIFATLKDSTSDLSPTILDAPTLNAIIQHIRKRTYISYIFHINAMEFVVPNKYKITVKNEEYFLFSDTFTECRPYIKRI
ncbi:hypothetical protein RF11_04573 [Thelohanellus kitauei]|uniref:Uncharacterized protein n=1 Tax=Thelohanellus kitauei TaxID=669202 RepID=A0A0C2MHR1_THEKT|nr:hypothetical protein RF11_04573 [Thelohanellus kitauei]